MMKKIYPRTGDKQTVYLNTVIKDSSIEVGDYTIYNDFVSNPLLFEQNNVLYHYPINHERLIIGKFCSIACGTKFLLNCASYTLRSLSTYTFPLFYEDWNLEKSNVSDSFVARAKTNVRIKPKIWKRRLSEGVVSDVIGCFTVYKSSKEYPEELRKLIVENPEDGTRYIFLTNNLNASAELISSLYRNRWSVELFFKWIKQHLRIKKFWGTSENAVRIQIYCAIITYYLLAIVQHDMNLERCVYEFLQIFGFSLTDKTHLSDLFDKSNFKKVKDRYNSSKPIYLIFNIVHF